MRIAAKFYIALSLVEEKYVFPSDNWKSELLITAVIISTSDAFTPLQPYSCILNLHRLVVTICIPGCTI